MSGLSEAAWRLWAWPNHSTYAERYASLASRRIQPDQVVVRLRSRSEVDAFLAGVGPVGPA